MPTGDQLELLWFLLNPVRTDAQPSQQQLGCPGWDYAASSSLLQNSYSEAINTEYHHSSAYPSAQYPSPAKTGKFYTCSKTNPIFKRII